MSFDVKVNQCQIWSVVVVTIDPMVADAYKQIATIV